MERQGRRRGEWRRKFQAEIHSRAVLLTGVHFLVSCNAVCINDCLKPRCKLVGFVEGRRRIVCLHTVED